MGSQGARGTLLFSVHLVERVLRNSCAARASAPRTSRTSTAASASPSPLFPASATPRPLPAFTPQYPVLPRGGQGSAMEPDVTDGEERKETGLVQCIGKEKRHKGEKRERVIQRLGRDDNERTETGIVSTTRERGGRNTSRIASPPRPLKLHNRPHSSFSAFQPLLLPWRSLTSCALPRPI